MAKNKGGRKPKYETPEALDEKCQAFFDHCEAVEKIPTLPGLAVFLGFAGREAIYDQEQRGGGFCHVIKKARSRLEESHLNKGRTMDIFALKNHYGYADKQEVDNTSSDNSMTPNFEVRFVKE